MNLTSAQSGAADTGVISRLRQIMDLLADPSLMNGASATELSRRAHLALPTVHRLLLQLAREEWAYQDPQTKRWYLGLRLITYGQIAAQKFPFVPIVQPILHNIVGNTRETAIFTLREGDYGTYAVIVESPEKLRLTETLGMRLPLTVGASRRVILAFLPEQEQRAIITRLCKVNPAVNAAAIQCECRRIVRQGYAISVGEVTPHTVGVTVPVLLQGRAWGSFMIAGPDTRITANKIPDLVQQLHHAAQHVETVVSQNS
ncbi:IclR family transcriptional regulator [Sulfobacillus thermosulfidooxidans]|uniref:IclR family transcriptional regulator n=1 Tax=Sulfobacillus thermosulfidooxidans TaxID=28034 RepID=UPI000B12D1C0|nr:IclR family transcriptional regulator [Sulfobacillus thermosulfidooxidans]